MKLFRYGATLALAALFTAAAHAQPVELKRDLQASGPAVTLGDLFLGTGVKGGVAVARAPAPGQKVTLSAGLIAAAAKAQGFEWTPMPGMSQVIVANNSNGSLLRAPKQYAALTTASPGLIPADVSSAPIADAAVHSGDIITLVYLAPGMQLTLRGKAMNDAQVGGRVRVVNLQSNTIVDALVTGAGAASANSGPSF